MNARRCLALFLICLILASAWPAFRASVASAKLPSLPRLRVLTPQIPQYLPFVVQRFAASTVTPTVTPTTLPTVTPSPTLGPGTTYTVTVAPGGSLVFSPSSLPIHVGDTVRWVWATGGHTVTSGLNGVPDGLFCAPDDTNCSTSPAMPVNTVYEHRFAQAGTFPYFCRIHFDFGMTAEIVVSP
jgi:plastocyanin